MNTESFEDSSEASYRRPSFSRGFHPEIFQRVTQVTSNHQSGFSCVVFPKVISIQENAYTETMSASH